jgi:hypothetical protein
MTNQLNNVVTNGTFSRAFQRWAQFYDNTNLQTVFCLEILTISPLEILTSSQPTISPTEGPNIIVITKKIIIIIVAISISLVVIGLSCFAFIKHLRHKKQKNSADQRWKLHEEYTRDTDVIHRSNPLSKVSNINNIKSGNNNNNSSSSNSSDLDAFFTLNSAFNNSKVDDYNKKEMRDIIDIKDIFNKNDKIKPSTRKNSMLTNALNKMTSTEIDNKNDFVRSIPTNKPLGENPLYNRNTVSKVDKETNLESRNSLSRRLSNTNIISNIIIIQF